MVRVENFLSKKERKINTTFTLSVLQSFLQLYLPDPGVQQQVIRVLQTETSLEELLQSVPLPVERVDDVLTGFDKWRLEHVRQERENTVQRLPFAGGILAISDTSEELGEDRKVKDKRCGKKRIFTFVENVHDVATTHEKLGVVLVDSALW